MHDFFEAIKDTEMVIAESEKDYVGYRFNKCHVAAVEGHEGTDRSVRPLVPPRSLLSLCSCFLTDDSIESAPLPTSSWRFLDCVL